MIWLTSFSIALLVLFSHNDCTQARRTVASKSPWADQNKAMAFMNCLVQSIAKSSVFPQQEKEDMESIVQTMSSAISSMSSSQRGNTQAQLQAMNMAFASSMAELVIAEDAGNTQAIAAKTEALSQTLKNCFQTTMGAVNRRFITEIKDLIQMFAKEAASSPELNEIQDSTQDTYTQENILQTSLTGPYKQITQTTVNQGTSTGIGLEAAGFSGFGAPDLGAPRFGAEGPAGPALSGPLSSIVNNMASALQSSTTMQQICRRDVSTQVKMQILLSAVQSTLSSRLGLRSSTASTISSAVQSSLQSLGSSADVASYVMALSSGLVSGLSSNGVINSSNAADISVALLYGMLQSAAGIASQFGISIPENQVQSDMRSVTSIMSSSSQTTSVSSISQTSVDLDTSAGIGLGGAVPSGFGAPDFGSPGYGAQGPAGPTGQALAGPLSSIVNNMATVLQSSTTMQQICRRGVSTQVKFRILLSAVQSTLSSKLGLAASTASSISSAVQSSLQSLGSSADVASYAMALSRVLVSGLSSTGVINSNNAADTSVALLTTLLQSAAGFARQFGISITEDQVQSDMRSVTSIMSSSSQTTSVSSTSQTSVDLGTSAGIGVGGVGPSGFGAPDLGAPGYGTQGPEGPTGQALSGPLSSIVNNMASALQSSATMQQICRRDVSTQVKIRILISAAKSALSSSLGLGSSTASLISSAVESSLQSLKYSGDVASYAKALSRGLVSALSSNGVINSSNAADFAGILVTGLIQSAVGIARQYGISINDNQVQSDIRSVTSIMSSTSQTTSVSSISQMSVDLGTSAGIGLGAAGPSGFGSRPLTNGGSLLSSPSGLNSPEASVRVQALSSAVLASLRPGGFDFNNFAQTLVSAIGNAQASGLSANEAKIEAFLEVLVAMIQILSNSKPGPVNLSATASLTSGLASSLAGMI